MDKIIILINSITRLSETTNTTKGTYYLATTCYHELFEELCILDFLIRICRKWELPFTIQFLNCNINRNYCLIKTINYISITIILEWVTPTPLQNFWNQILILGLILSSRNEETPTLSTDSDFERIALSKTQSLNVEEELSITGTWSFTYIACQYQYYNHQSK